ncbi:YaaR family protein [Gracilibacillus sp. S3-1-1]|uniref:YaaR family protein n=1 Tax=Gracilibacillus pellucidus TaxID=3095368 RepID=A0ACC6M988_9BACI|nr:YaaR family protein [Gracilibacillus sp. S3-1-1]MDX8047514.1 YaaR family protein [Gracilibacillus sp. S3-1-1]
MKITQDMRTQLEALNKKEQQARQPSQRFDSMVKQQSTQLQQTELQKLMSELTAQGQKIARFRSFKDLAKYKRMVKRFVKEAVDYGMTLKQSHSFMLDGDNRRLTIVEEVDDKLVELTEFVMDQEKNSIQILDLIGEIKGLLVNLYT